jgi:hypothetical protein
MPRRVSSQTRKRVCFGYLSCGRHFPNPPAQEEEVDCAFAFSGDANQHSPTAPFKGSLDPPHPSTSLANFKSWPHLSSSSLVINALLSLRCFATMTEENGSRKCDCSTRRTWRHRTGWYGTAGRLICEEEETDAVTGLQEIIEAKNRGSTRRHKVGLLPVADIVGDAMHTGAAK